MDYAHAKERIEGNRPARAYVHQCGGVSGYNGDGQISKKEKTKMNNIAIKEVNKEVHIIIFLDKNFPDQLSAMREASKMLQREVLYYESHPDKYIPR